MMAYPVAVGVCSFVLLIVAAEFGAFTRRKRLPIPEEERGDFATILGATLTLLGLLIGFSFSMAINRYDQRKTFEEAEANAIGTEYLRLELLPGVDVPHGRELLREYLEQRMLFYTVKDQQKLMRVDARTSELQTELWNVVRGPSVQQPGPIAAMVAAGMNDVLNSQGYTQAAWWNRIPTAAWILMFSIAICCNVLLGYGTRVTDHKLLIILPIAVSIAFFLIADIDSPRRGMIRVVPQNLVSLQQTLK